MANHWHLRAQCKVLGLAFLWVLSFTIAEAGVSNTPLLLRRPTVSRNEIAFSYGGDLWIVNRSGGEARRLTSDVGIETDPYFSPDGKWAGHGTASASSFARNGIVGRASIGFLPSASTAVSQPRSHCPWQKRAPTLPAVHTSYTFLSPTSKKLGKPNAA